MADLALPRLQSDAVLAFKRKRIIAACVPVIILAYLAYVFVAFDVWGISERARWDNAAIIASDSWSHKVHVTRNHRSGSVDYAVEGERKGRYPEGTRPDWVSGDEIITLDLEDGHVLRLLPDNAMEYDVPGYGLITAQFNGSTVDTNFGEAAPDWANVGDRRVSIRTDVARVTITRSKTEIFKYFPGWELFFFTLDSPYSGASFGDIFFGAQIDPDRSNLTGAWQDFWGNPMWRHSDVVWAIGETILMAFLGTFGAAMISLPLAFLATKKFTPFAAVRAIFRRIFDFVRGVDALIWTIVLSRAFGPGPLTGALAILIADAGTFGKIFSEALENVDDKQIEGVASTGAKPLQRYRFGVIPQVVPILLSQLLYWFESNTRSATIIGAITGGGIGLMLTQAIQTQKDWEEVSYYVILIILMIIFMDWVSGLLRQRLIRGDQG